MDPVMWERYEPPTWAYALSWSEFKYEAIARAAQLDREIKSDLPGLYIFYIRPTNPLNGFPKLPLYIGISNERDSRRPLRDRLKDYLPARVATKKKRQNIDRMLRQYYGVLWVTYCLIDKASVDLSALETKLHGFMHPTVGRRDFPVEVKTQQKAFGKI